MKVIYGPPGTGKTTRLAGIAREYGDRGKLGVVSFSRAAAHELTARDMGKPEYIGTAHALAFKLLGLSRSQVVDPENFINEYGDRTIVEEALAVGHLVQVKGIDFQEAFLLRAPPVTYLVCKSIWEDYQSWMEYSGLLDFDAMLLRATGLGPVFDALIVDEAQDLSPAQWKFLISTVKDTSGTILAGDDDQCQPGHTTVETSQGSVQMANLKTGDRVLSYSRQHSEFSFRRAKVVSRSYCGHLYRVRTPNHQSEYTPNHRCIVRFKPRPELRALYLMQKGEFFRVGQTKAFLVQRGGGSITMYPVNRARQEGADRFWVLGFFDSEAEAYVAEQVVATKFGLPQTIFDARGLGLRAKYCDKVWQALAEQPDIDWAVRAAGALGAYGKNFQYPHIKHNGGSKHFECYAINLDPKVHQLAEYRNGRLEWVDFSLEHIPFTGEVYSLDVDKTQTYIADGIYTHNSIFSWSGATPEILLDLVDSGEADHEVLAQSYRLPALIHRAAESIVTRISRRHPKEYAPRPAVGRVTHAGFYEPLDGPHTVLGRYATPLEEVEALLIDRGIPYLWRNRKVGPLNGPLARIARAVLNHDLDTLKKMERYLSPVALEEMERGSVPTDWVTAINPTKFDFRMVGFLQMCGPDADPVVHLSTIHSFKGREDDHIVLLADMPMPSETALSESVASLDDELRVWYVGLTRARECLHVIGQNDLLYDLPG